MHKMKHVLGMCECDQMDGEEHHEGQNDGHEGHDDEEHHDGHDHEE